MTFFENMLGLGKKPGAPVDARTHSGGGQSVLHSPEMDPVSAGKVESEKKNPEAGDIFQNSEGDLIKFVSVAEDGTFEAHIMPEKVDGAPSEHPGKDYFGDIAQLTFVRKAEGAKEENASVEKAEKNPILFAEPLEGQETAIQMKAHFSPEQQEEFDSLKAQIFAIYEQSNQTVIHVTKRLTDNLEKIDSEKYSTLQEELKQIVSGFKTQVDLYENTLKTERNPNSVLNFSRDQLDLLGKSLENLDNFAHKFAGTLRDQKAAAPLETALTQALKKEVQKESPPKASSTEEDLQTGAEFTPDQADVVQLTVKKISELAQGVDEIAEDINIRLTDGKGLLGETKWKEYKEIVEADIKLFDDKLGAFEQTLRKDVNTVFSLDQQKRQHKFLEGCLRDLERVSARLSKDLEKTQTSKVKSAKKPFRVTPEFAAKPVKTPRKSEEETALPSALNEKVVDLSTAKKRKEMAKEASEMEFQALLEEQGVTLETYQKVIRAAENSWASFLGHLPPGEVSDQEKRDTWQKVIGSGLLLYLNGKDVEEKAGKIIADRIFAALDLKYSKKK